MIASLPAPFWIGLALIVYTAAQLARTRHPSYLAWLFANVMLVLSGFVHRPELTWAFYAGIVLTVVLQLRSRRDPGPRPITPEEYLQEARNDASGRDQPRAGAGSLS